MTFINTYFFRAFSIAIIFLVTLFNSSVMAGGGGALLACFPLNGNANDIIGGHNGIINGCQTTSDRFGKIDGAYEFNGITDYISVADADVFSFPDAIFSISGGYLLRILLVT